MSGEQQHQQATNGQPIVIDKQLRQRIGAALAHIPSSLFIMTSHWEDHSRGVMVSWVQQVAFEPPMVVVSLAKGRHIVPLIHDSHTFALCQICPDDKLTVKKFSRTAEAVEDQFQGIDWHRGVTGSPILGKALAYLDCELIRHFDIDADHDLYVGLVRDGGIQHPGQPIINKREDGFAY
jgi:flavin reductase (DIM6/NTAB) family NADH-FMN oxidoreductase RutF